MPIQCIQYVHMVSQKRPICNALHTPWYRACGTALLDSTKVSSTRLWRGCVEMYQVREKGGTQLIKVGVYTRKLFHASTRC